MKIDGTNADGDSEERIYHFNSEYSLIAAEGVTQPYWRYGSLVSTWSTFVFYTSFFLMGVMAYFDLYIELYWWWMTYAGMAWGFIQMGVSYLWVWAWWQGQKVLKEDIDDDQAQDTSKGTAAASFVADIETDMAMAAIEWSSGLITMLAYSDDLSWGMKKRMHENEMKEEGSELYKNSLFRL